MSMSKKSLLLLSTIAVTLTGCATTTEDNRDPYENYNRSMYAFNDSAYEYLRPVAKGYDAVVPDSVQNGLFNFFNNLREIGRIANDSFQGEWGYAGDDSLRFLTNTTVGVLGFFDVADDWYGKEMRYNQSFAVTLHKWGVYKDGEKSPYVVWPLIGPGTMEDLATGVDALFNPLTYTFLIPGVGFAAYAVEYGVTGAYYFNQGASYLPAYDNLSEVSVDPYVAMRNAYLQNYDYGMAKVLKQELNADKATMETDMAVLGVLGMDNADLSEQKAASGNADAQQAQPAVLYKSKLDRVNKASNVDEIYDAYYATDSTAVDLNDLEGGDAKAAPTDDMATDLQSVSELLDEPAPKADSKKAVKTSTKSAQAELASTASSIQEAGQTMAAK